MLFTGDGEARFHVGCRYKEDPPEWLKLRWMTEAVNDTDAFIRLLPEGRSKYWCATCNTLLLDVWIYPSLRCAGKRMRVSFVD
jgi:hypothetical protein